MKLADIPPGTDLAYRRAAKVIVEQVEFELETCRRLLAQTRNRFWNSSQTHRTGASSSRTRMRDLDLQLSCSTRS